ncbi:MAG: hypothetical protein E7C81_05770 [Atopobium sp.]|nr:hypothetical protein [Atopobium sp.]
MQKILVNIQHVDNFHGIEAHGEAGINYLVERDQIRQNAFLPTFPR